MTYPSSPDGLALSNPALDATREPLRSNWPSPGLACVRPGLPPAIMFHGRADTTVPYAQAKACCEAIAENATRCQLVGFQDIGHGFFNYG
jgi:alpha-beta hydrolase superfamily lysophospholipase